MLVRFDADALDLALPAAGPQGMVQAIRAIDTGTTVSIDVGPRFGSYRGSFVPQDDGGAGDRRPAAGRGRAGPAAARARRARRRCPCPQAPEAPAAGGPVRRRAASGRSSSTRATAATTPARRGASGALEKDVTLALARRLKALLESRLGVRVLLTRDADQAVTPDDRAALANNNMADLFVSLHAQRLGAHGAERRPDLLPLRRPVRRRGAQGRGQPPDAAHARRRVADDRDDPLGAGAAAPRQ